MVVGGGSSIALQVSGNGIEGGGKVEGKKRKKEKGRVKKSPAVPERK